MGTAVPALTIPGLMRTSMVMVMVMVTQTLRSASSS